ncbi:MAG: radical SAM protein, partial [Acidobacteriota bacterium]|nr:radical SAM protein [Acidobacteriota bacterium]
AARVFLSITTLDDELAGKLEPRCSRPQRRLQAIRELTAAGVPCGVMVAPVIPGLNDHEIPKILQAAAEAGADTAGYILLRLPGAVEGLFTEWLRQHVPTQESKVLHRLASMRGGKLQDSRFGHRMRGTGVVADQIRRLFDIARRRHGLDKSALKLSTASFRRPGDSGRLFEL